MHLACQRHDRKVIERLLLAKARVDVLTLNGDTALHILAQHSELDEDLWEMLMSFYADFQNVKNNQGKTALDILKLNNEFNENFLSRRPS